METFRNRNILYAAMIVLVTVMVLFFLIGSVSNKNPYGNYLEISNLGEYTKGKPSDKNTLGVIKNELYKTVSLNVDYDLKSGSIDDILVREGTFKQRLNKDRGMHEVSFIIDIKSLGQSYRVEYEWGENEEAAANNLAGYGTQVSCLPVEDLVYDNFYCETDRSIEMGEGMGIEALESMGSYTDIGGPFKISFAGKAEGVAAVGVSDSTPDGRKAALKWLRSRNIDPTDVVIYYYDYHNPFVDFDGGVQEGE